MKEVAEAIVPDTQKANKYLLNEWFTNKINNIIEIIVLLQENEKKDEERVCQRRASEQLEGKR